MEGNASAKTKNPVLALVRYVRESKEELEKVAWPTRSEIVRYSVLVVTACVVMAFFFTGLDFALTVGLDKLIQASAR